jgi:hypothetical protein
MGEGSDFMDGGGGYEQAPQGGGEYYATGSQVPVPGNWGPAPQPQYAPHPQYQQPPPEYQPQQTQQPYPRQALPQRRRKASKGLQRMYQVQCWEELLNAPIFGDANDPSAQIVQNEVYAFAERRINELLGEAPEKPVHELTSQEVQVLKALAQKMLEPEEEAPAEQQEDEPPAPPAPPQAPPRPPPPARAPVAPPRAQPVQQPAPQAPLPPPPPRGASRVVARPTPAQLQAQQERAQPPPRPQLPQNVGPVRQPPATMVDPQMQPIHHQQPIAEAPSRRRGGGRRKSAEQQAPPAKPGPPPPLRYAMPTGQGMTAISAIKAQEQIEQGGTVLSETFVKSNK